MFRQRIHVGPGGFTREHQHAHHAGSGRHRHVGVEPVAHHGASLRLEAQGFDLVQNHACVGFSRDVFGVDAGCRLEHRQVGANIGQSTVGTRADHVGVAGHQRDARMHVDAGPSDLVVGQFRVVAEDHVLRIGTLRVDANGLEHASHAFGTDQPRLRDVVLLQPSKQVVG